LLSQVGEAPVTAVVSTHGRQVHVLLHVEATTLGGLLLPLSVPSLRGVESLSSLSCLDTFLLAAFLVLGATSTPTLECHFLLRFLSVVPVVVDRELVHDVEHGHGGPVARQRLRVVERHLGNLLGPVPMLQMNPHVQHGDAAFVVDVEHGVAVAAAGDDLVVLVHDYFIRV